MKAGAARESLVYFSFEDERLAGMTALDLQLVVEEYYKLYPTRRDREKTTFLLDEIQLVAGWETFARRILDSETIELFVSGSSAKFWERPLPVLEFVLPTLLARHAHGLRAPVLQSL